MKTFIYSLDCPITGAPKYIGKTWNPEQRLKQHIRTKEKGKKYAWIKSLKNQGLLPKMTIIDEANVDVNFWEDWSIDYYRFLGFELKNMKSGGVGGRLSLETKNKISTALKGKPKSEEHRRQSIKNLNSIGQSPWNKGIILSEENKAKAVKALTDYRANNPHYNIGKRVSEETKQKIKDTFKERYGWIKKEAKFESKEAYNLSRSRTVKCTGLKNGECAVMTLTDCRNKGYVTSNIINCINGKRKSAHGFTWEYI